MNDSLINSIPNLLIVTAVFYKDIADELVRGAVAELEKVEASYQVISVPGVFEVPAAIGFAVDTNRYDGFIALGCVIKGETPHFDFVCSESARGLNDIAINLSVPVGYGIITALNKKQAIDRASTMDKNKGGEAAKACLKMIKVKRAFDALIELDDDHENFV